MTVGSAIAAFFSGTFFANFVPHFVKGSCGDGFPTPFAKPSGIGLSSPRLNVAWGLANLVACFFLFRAGRIATDGLGAIASFFAGLALLSLTMSSHFARKHRE